MYAIRSYYVTEYKDRLAELNGGPSKDAKKAHDDITQSIGLEIEALEKGDRAAAISAAMQKLGATATKQQREEVTAVITSYSIHYTKLYEGYQ